MKHFVMSCNGIYPNAAINDPPLGMAPWMSGHPISNGSTPLIYTLDPQRPGNLVPFYYDSAYPLMRDDLIEALHAAGVDNIQFFDAVIRDTIKNQDHTNFKAFNIVGLVSAADMNKSTLMGTSDSEMIDVDFDSLAIDEKRASQFKLFRLAENVSAVIVDEVVKNEIERREIPGMVFYDPSDWSG